MSATIHAAPLGTAFTYQGELDQAGVGVTGNCDFSFGLWDAAAGGAMVDQADLFSVPVSDGVFTVQLDFGADAFNGQARWLEIAVVCPAGGALTPLSPRQELTASPHALYALEAGSMDFSGLTNVPAGLSDGDDVNDADADPANEIQDLELSGTTLSLSGDASPVDLSGFLDDTDDQTLAEVLAQGNDAGGATITNLPAPAAASDAATMAYVDGHTDGDSDAANELQNLFATVNADTGGTTADALADSLSVVGSGSVSTAIAGDTLTITGSGISAAVGDPAPIGSLGIGDEPQSVYVSGRYAYVTDGVSNDLKVIDLSDPSAPALVGSLGMGGDPTSVHVAGRYAYVTDQAVHDLWIIDVSDPSSPALAGMVDTGGQPLSVQVSGRYAYVAAYGSQVLQIFDITDPAAPSLAGSVGAGANPRFLDVAGRYAYVLHQGSDDLKVFDVSDPSSPALAGSVPVGSNPQSVYVSGRYAYVVDPLADDLRVIDVSDPASPTLAGSLSVGAGPQSVFVSGRFAYLADRVSNELNVVDVSDPSNPALAGSLDIGVDPVAVHVSGRYAYVIDEGSDDLKVLDVSGVELPSAIAHSLEAGNLQVRNDVVAQGQLQVGGGVNVGAGGVFTDGNLGLSGTLAIANDIAPTSSPANAVQLYAEDDTGSSELRVRDEAGNITTLSPHNFSLIGAPSEPMAWSFFSENAHGKVNVDMMRTVRLVEALSGEKLVYTEPKGTAQGEAFADRSNVDGRVAGDALAPAAGFSELVEAVRQLAAQKDAEIRQLKAANRAMQDRLEALERRLN